MDKFDKALDIMNRNAARQLREMTSDLSHDYKLDALSDVDSHLEALRESLEEDSKRTRCISVWTLIVSAGSLIVGIIALLLALH